MANNGNGKSLESWIWDAACSIRGAQDAPKYKDFILPLIFVKRLCDVFDDEIDRIAQEVGSRAKAFRTLLHQLMMARIGSPNNKGASFETPSRLPLRAIHLRYCGLGQVCTESIADSTHRLKLS